MISVRQAFQNLADGKFTCKVKFTSIVIKLMKYRSGDPPDLARRLACTLSQASSLSLDGNFSMLSQILVGFHLGDMKITVSSCRQSVWSETLEPGREDYRSISWREVANQPTSWTQNAKIFHCNLNLWSQRSYPRERPWEGVRKCRDRT